MLQLLMRAQGPLIHALAGLLTPFWIYSWTETPADGRVLVACMLLALLPDIDSQASLLGRLFPFISEPIERRFGHRQITHSLLALLGVTAVTFLLFRADWWLLTAAYGSHLIVDMLVGFVGIPLLWPSQVRFYLISIRPESTAELFLGGIIGLLLLLPLFENGRRQVVALIPQEDIVLLPTATPTATATPRIVTIRIDNVYDLDRELLISVGDMIERGQPIANLHTHHQLQASPTPSSTPSPTATFTPTPSRTPSPMPTPDPLHLAELENTLNLARARYQSVIATTTPNALFMAQVDALASQIQDRQDCLHAHALSNSEDDWRAWNCQQELAQLAAQGTAVALTAQPQNADVLDADIAYYQLRAAEIAYAQAITQLTPNPTPTAINTQLPTQTTIPQTVTPSPPHPLTPSSQTITAFLSGQVLSIQVISVRGNAATIEIQLLVPFDPRFDPAIATATPTPLPQRLPATAVRVIDGDTAVFLVDGREETVRFIGIDTPETHHPTLPVECYGRESESYTKELLGRGTAVVLELDEEERDGYGRLLAYVYLPDGTMLNELLVAQGYATTLGEQKAQSNALGLWIYCLMTRSPDL